MANGNGSDVKIPQTITPLSVWVGNGILLFVIWATVTVLLVPFSEEWAPTWGLFVTFLTLGIAIYSGIITQEIVDFHGVLLFNPWARTRRVLFQGLSFKLPWEKVEEDGNGNIVLTSLMRTISSKETKGHPSKDPAVTMEAALLIHLKINISGTSEQAAENFVRFRGVIKEEALTEVVRATIEKMFAEYYAEHEMQDLLKPNVIQEAVMGDQKNKDVIKAMEEKYGSSIGVVLESSKANKATQDMMRTPAMASALAVAIKKLIDDGGMDPEPARRAALLLDPNTDYKEDREEYHITLDAPDLQHLTNLRDVNIVPVGALGKGKEKK